MHLRPGDYRVQPWKNGGGETREIARDPGEPFDWRLSWATIAGPGPFSPYPGYDRALVLLEGGPVTLLHEEAGHEHELRALEPYWFRGDLRTRAVEVAEPSEDFNVIVRRGLTRTRLHVSSLSGGEERLFSLDTGEHFLFVVRGAIDLGAPSPTEPIALGARETLRLPVKDHTSSPLRARAREQAVCIWVSIRTYSSS